MINDQAPEMVKKEVTKWADAIKCAGERANNGQGYRVNNRRKILFALGAGSLVAPLASLAQQQSKVWRIGYLDFSSRLSTVESGKYGALMDGLRERGYVEGRNFVLEARYAEGNTDRLAEFATEMIRQKVDLILSSGGQASHAAKRATATIPIVVTNIADPVRDGFVVSLARPGGNMTGMTGGVADSVQKLVELLIVAVPKLKRLALIANATNETHPLLLLRAQDAARQTGIQVLPVSVRTPEEIERGFGTMAHARVDAVIILADSLLYSQRMKIAEFALKHQLPSIYPQLQYPEAGGLMSYGSDFNDNFRRAGNFVDKILKGAKPGDIPFEQPTRYYLVVNCKTANALGVKISAELLARADKVIE